MGHFVLSILILGDAVVLVHRAGLPDGVPTEPSGRPVERRAAVAQFLLTCVVVVTGTVVTNSGPHAGDLDAKRFDLRLTDIARVHSATTILLLLTVVATVLVIGRAGLGPARLRALSWLLVVVVAQMAVGYTQYFTGVPALLVAVHILGAVLVFTASLRVLLVNWRPAFGPAAMHDGPGPDRVVDEPERVVAR